MFLYTYWAIKVNFCILVVPLNKALVCFFWLQILDIFCSISIYATYLLHNSN